MGGVCVWRVGVAWFVSVVLWLSFLGVEYVHATHLHILALGLALLTRSLVRVCACVCARARARVCVRASVSYVSLLCVGHVGGVAASEQVWWCTVPPRQGACCWSEWRGA